MVLIVVPPCAEMSESHILVGSANAELWQSHTFDLDRQLKTDCSGET